MNSQILVHDQPYAYRLELVRAQASSVARRTVFNALSIALVEGLALAVALVAAGLIRQVWIGEAKMVVGSAWLVIPVYVGLAALVRLLPGYGLGAVEELRRVTWTVSGVFAVAVVGLWLAGPDLAAQSQASRLTLVLAGMLSLVLVPLARVSLKAWLTRIDAWGVPVVVYGAGPAGAKIVRQLQEERGMGYIPYAVFDDDRLRWGDFLDMVPIVGGTERVTAEAAVAFLAMPEADTATRADLLDGPLACYSTVVLVPDLLDAPSLWVKPRDFVGVLGLEITRT